MIEWCNRNKRVDPIIYLEAEKSTQSNSTISLPLALTNLIN